MPIITISSIISLLLLCFILYKVKGKLTELLKDMSVMADATDRSYSLSKTIFLFWTVIIFSSLFYLGIGYNDFPPLNSSTLILLGIAAATAAAGAAVDHTQSADPTVQRMQDVEKTKGFLTDILSDQYGLSLSRCQTMGFNLIYGCVFISTVIAKHTFYLFTPETLTLLGISTGAYALLKIPENSSTK